MDLPDIPGAISLRKATYHFRRMDTGKTLSVSRILIMSPLLILFLGEFKFFSLVNHVRHTALWQGPRITMRREPNLPPWEKLCLFRQSAVRLRHMSGEKGRSTSCECHSPLLMSANSFDAPDTRMAAIDAEQKTFPVRTRHREMTSTSSEGLRGPPSSAVVLPLRH